MGFTIVEGSPQPGEINVINGPDSYRNFVLEAYQELTGQPEARTGDLPWNRAFVIVFQGMYIPPSLDYQQALHEYSNASKAAEEALAKNETVVPIPHFAKIFPLVTLKHSSVPKS